VGAGQGWPAIVQYMLILTETLYLVPPAEQRLFFNEGMHRSMIWVLDKFIQTMRKVSVPSGLYKGKAFACTFENIDIGSRENSFLALTDLGDKAVAAAKTLAQKDSAKYKSFASNVAYYVNSALTATDSEGASMHLPDVKDFWNGDTPVSNG